jgi:mono/diheme cytochrome c family protein
MKDKKESIGMSKAVKPTAALDSGEGMNVRETHAAIMREHEEPLEGREPTPLWLVTLVGVIVFCSGFYVANYSGGFNPLVFDEKSGGANLAAKPSGPVDMVTLGKRTFQNTCQACHQESGLGLPGQYPPLAGSEWVQASDPVRIVRIALDGLHGPVLVKGETFNNIMVPWRGALSDQQLAAVLTYVRQAWGNKAPAVNEPEVKEIREATQGRGGLPWTAPELEKVPLKG